MKKIITYDKKTNKIINIYSGFTNIKETDEVGVKIIQSQDLSQTDIRAYNDDGTVKSLERQVEEGILELEKDEVITDDKKCVRQLIPSIPQDLKILVERGVEKLDPKLKFIDTDHGVELVQKEPIEQLEENLIDDAEFDTIVDNFRKVDYTSNVDPLVMELLISFLSNNKDKMNQDELQMLEKIVETKKEIKQKFMKAKNIRKLKNI